MAINADKPRLWKTDIAASVDLFNRWFMKFAPRAYRDARVVATKQVEACLTITANFATVTPEVLKSHPEVLQTLRQACCPPLARDRLTGLAGSIKALVKALEDGRVPPRMAAKALEGHLRKICDVLVRMLDVEIFPWLSGSTAPGEEERYRAATIVADRLCGALSDPIVRNAQEKRQLCHIARHLRSIGYKARQHPASLPISDMQPGTFSFRTNVRAKSGDRAVNIPIDVVIQPKKLRRGRLPILVEAKSAGDFTNVNKRRKEEATKVRQLRETYGSTVVFVLFLCGYFDSGYLGYEAAEGIDWVWEHRAADLNKLGL